jgi:putative ATP-binding cassette transporter
MPDNPDQRIQDDINQFTGATVSLTMGLLNATCHTRQFCRHSVGVESAASASAWLATTTTIAGYMVWMAVLYCLRGQCADALHRPATDCPELPAAEAVEADFRHHLIRVREYSEAIALDRGEKVEGHLHLTCVSPACWPTTCALLKAQKNLIWFTAFFGQAALIFPFLVAAPRFFSGAIQLGELMQISSAFDRVQGSLSWFVDNYSSVGILASHHRPPDLV